jgi:hypothetical protein
VPPLSPVVGWHNFQHPDGRRASLCVWDLTPVRKQDCYEVILVASEVEMPTYVSVRLYKSLPDALNRYRALVAQAGADPASLWPPDFGAI